MINKVAVIATILLALVIGGTGFVAFHYYGKYASELTTNKTITAANKTATDIVNDQQKLFSLFNTISGTTSNDQAKNTAASQDREVVIQTVIKTEPCYSVPVPAAAASVLLQHYNAIRTNAGDTDTSQPTATVSSVTTTK